MREKYESLSLAVLKDLAKARGMKGISTLRKPALIERMLEEDAKESDRGNSEEVHKSTPAENTAKEKNLPGRYLPDRSNVSVCFFFSSRTVRIYP